MRIKSVANNKDQNEFAEYLLNIGDGKIENIITGKYIDEIKLPTNVGQNLDELELIKLIYPDIQTNYTNHEFMCQRAILAPKNQDVDRINSIAASYFPGESVTYLSADSVTCPKQAAIYPTEFLNKMDGNGLPQHKLILKVNQPIILLRNVAQNQGLCNGTKMIIKKFHKHFIDCEIANGKHAGKS
jgi:ATP-dependent DNA helicase PIF1